MGWVYGDIEQVGCNYIEQCVCVCVCAFAGGLKYYKYHLGGIYINAEQCCNHKQLRCMALINDSLSISYCYEHA